MTREEAIKTVMSATVWTDEEREALGILVPELRESEDERTRKELIFFLKGEIPQCSIEEHADKLKEFVSYLEKLKDYFLVPKSHIDPVGEPGVDGMELFKKQKERKPRWEINNPYATEWTKEMIDEKFEELVEECHKQKPAERNEEIREYLIEELKAAKSVGELKFAIPQPTREECISYLENLKEKGEERNDEMPVESTPEYEIGFQDGMESGKTEKRGGYIPKDKVYEIMKKLMALSMSDRIPIESEEYAKIDEITRDVRSLLDIPLPKFREGDTIRLKNSDAEYTIERIEDGRYYCRGCSIDIPGCDRDYELVVPANEKALHDEYERGKEEGERAGLIKGFDKGYNAAEKTYNETVAYHYEPAPLTLEQQEKKKFW